MTTVNLSPSPLTVEWRSASRVLQCNFSNATNERLQQDLAVIDHAIGESKEPIIHLLGNFTEVTKIPGIITWARVRFRSWDRIGWFVVYGLQNQSLHMLLSYVVQLHNVKIHFCETQAQALDFLQRVDQTLPQPRHT